MTARAPDLSTEAAVRQAVAFGKQAAIREIIDALHAELGKVRGNWDYLAILGFMHAIDTVKATRIDPREDPA